MKQGHWKTLPGWFDFGDVYDLAIRRVNVNRKAQFVEIGAWLGKSTCYMAEKILASKKEIAFSAVDTWEGSPTEQEHQDTIAELGAYGVTLRDAFSRNVIGGGFAHVVRPIQGPSVAAATMFEDNSLDFVYIDGDHRYGAVLADIRAWFPKVRVGGILAGHDFTFDPVARAVKEIFGQAARPFGKRSWIVEKTESVLKCYPSPRNSLFEWADELPLRLFPVEHYVDKLNERELFSFSRWGDGEWRAVMLGRYQLLYGKGGQSMTQNCDGHVFYPEMCRDLGDILCRSPEYVLGLQGAALKFYGAVVADFLTRNDIDPEWHNADVFHIASREGNLASLIRAVRSLPVVYAGPSYLQSLDELLGIDHFIPVPEENCYLVLDRIIDDVRIACRKTEAPFLVGISASMPAGIILDRLYDEFGDKAFLIDFGSVFDPYGGRNTRGYHEALSVEKVLS